MEARPVSTRQGNVGNEFHGGPVVFLLVAAFLVGLGVAGRLLPHPPNFTPLAAIALFAGFLFRDARLAMAIPLSALIVSDAWLGTYDVRLMIAVYAAMLCPVLLRRFLRNRLSPLRVLCSAGASTAAFFLITNFAVWYLSGMYAKTLLGLGACYAAALPFLKHTLAGNVLWCTVLFGAYALARAFVPGTLAARTSRRRVVGQACVRQAD